MTQNGARLRRWCLDGAPGVATIPHLSAELLSKAAGIRIMHIPYKGATQQIQDLLAGVTRSIDD